MKTEKLSISGMHCASCVLKIETGLKKLPGVQRADVNFATEKGQVVYDEAKCSLEDILSQVKKTGYEAAPLHMESAAPGHHGMHHESGEDHSGHAVAESDSALHSRFIKLVVAAVLSIGIVVLGMQKAAIPQAMEIMMILSLGILIYSGHEFFERGIPGLFRLQPGMDTLVALGVGAAFAYSSWNTLFAKNGEEYFMDVGLISTFILLGRYLEARAKGKASQAIKKLLELSAKVAHRLKPDGSVEEIPVDQVKIGDLLRVKPGEKIPTDGVMTEGYGTLNEAMVTGESIPVDKAIGDKLIGATLNGNTAFTMRAEKIGSETLLAHIVKLVEDAQMQKAPIQKLVDIISGYFVWGVIGIASITFGVWFYALGVPAAEALIHTVAVLIIACPCALGLATPISIVVGSGKGAEMGILLKKPESLEKTHKVTAMAFDKTGTLTKGEPTVQFFKNLKGAEKDNLITALSLEAQSEHPLARSVVHFSQQQGAVALPTEHFEAKPGLGVSAKIDGRHFILGSKKFMESLKVKIGALDSEWKTLEAEGYTVLVLATEGEPLAMFGLQDTVKETSKEAIAMLKKQGIRTVMLTGDNEKVAEHIAKAVGIDEVHAGIAPGDKKSIIETLQKEGHFVAMVGDGINDSPALAQADVGIAMGTGTDIAMESGDLVIVKGDLKKAVEAIALSRSTLRNIKQNLFWAFIYNSIGIPVAAMGLLNPAVSALAMGLSSVSVVTNALRLKRFKV